MIKKVMFLLISAGLTIIATFVQQISSSDSPYKADININNIDYSFKLPVVHEGSEDCVIEINIPDTAVHGKLLYKNIRTRDNWKTCNLSRMGDNLVNVLPQQKANTKIEYYFMLNSKGKTYEIAKDKPVIVRFQETVPKFILFPEVILLFIALIFACFSGFLTISHVDSYKKYAKLTFYILAGTLLLGLTVHLIQFRTLLLQIMPYNDLSFYKNLVILLIWWGIYSFNKKFEFQYLTLAATVITIVIYCLPQHIMFGWIGRLLY